MPCCGMAKEKANAGQENSKEISVPQEVIAAMGGMPIPPPPTPVTGADTDTSLQEETVEKAVVYRDSGGLMAAPVSRESIAVRQRIGRVRKVISQMVEDVQRAANVLRPALADLSAESEVCVQEGFDVLLATELMAEIERVLETNLN